MEQSHVILTLEDYENLRAARDTAEAHLQQVLDTEKAITYSNEFVTVNVPSIIIEKYAQAIAKHYGLEDKVDEIIKKFGTQTMFLWDVQKMQASNEAEKNLE